MMLYNLATEQSDTKPSYIRLQKMVESILIGCNYFSAKL